MCLFVFVCVYAQLGTSASPRSTSRAVPRKPLTCFFEAESLTGCILQIGWLTSMLGPPVFTSPSSMGDHKPTALHLVSMCFVGMELEVLVLTLQACYRRGHLPGLEGVHMEESLQGRTVVCEPEMHRVPLSGTHLPSE